MRVLVTGGAVRIGAALTQGLARAGHAVAIHCNSSRDEAEVLAATLAEAGATVAVVSADLTDPAAARGLVDAARTVLGGPIEGLVNSAAIFEYDAVPIRDHERFDRHMHLNLAAPLILSSSMAEQDDVAAGAIVNILDQKVANLNPDFLTYSCSKVALEGATKMLAQALAPRFRVNAVAPGLSLPSAGQSDSEFSEVASVNLLRRPVETAAVADAVTFLLANPAITGQVLFADNGQRFLPRDGDVMFQNKARP